MRELTITAVNIVRDAPFRPFARIGLVLLLVAFVISGSATGLSAAESGKNSVSETENIDPLEPVNRVIFGFNDIVYGVLIRPLAIMYNDFLPEEVQDGIHSMLENLKAPVILANDLMQGEMTRALETLQRFAINSTVGVAGIKDWATEWGIPKHTEDFGQTLGAWGLDGGPYLVIPILGPSNLRDGVGRIVDSFIDPFDRWANNIDHEEYSYARTGVGGVDTYSEVMEPIEKVRETSIDFYATMRSLYRQRRDAEIRNGKLDDKTNFPAMPYNLEASEADGPDWQPMITITPAGALPEVNG